MVSGFPLWCSPDSSPAEEYFEDKGSIYVVTELCEGGNIGELDPMEDDSDEIRRRDRSDRDRGPARVWVTCGGTFGGRTELLPEAARVCVVVFLGVK